MSLPLNYDYRPLPDYLDILPSNIEGKGLFCTKKIEAFFNIGLSHIKIEDEIIRLPLGGFINHSYNPNCEIKSLYGSNEYYLQTIKKIDANEELTVNYYNSVCGKKST